MQRSGLIGYQRSKSTCLIASNSLLRALPLCLFVLMVACSKHSDTVADSGCIQRVVDSVGETSLRTGQIDSIKAFFRKNNMSIDGLQFLGFTPDIYTDTALIPQAQIWANLFVNGLPVFR